MRKIGTLAVGESKILERYLIAQEIDVSLRATTDGMMELWVVDDKDWDQALDIIGDFSKDPQNPLYRNIPPGPAQEKQKKRNRYVDVRTQIFHRSAVTKGKVTLTLIVICIVVFLLHSMQLAPQFTNLFYFSEYIRPPFKEILGGQVWRLVTPIFLHFGIWHVLFNMWWLYDLGNQIEQRDSPRYLLSMTLVIGAVSNVAQFLVSGPLFGGFSGVVYGLLGYVWMLDRFKPERGYRIDKFIVVFMMVWLILGMLGVIGNVANATHVFGLISGVVWGLIASGRLGLRGIG